MILRPMLASLCLGVAGCAGGADFDARERAALDRELAGRIAGEPRACVPADAANGLQIVGDGTLVYRRGDTVWVNRPLTDCAATRPPVTLLVEATASQYCRGDRVRAVEPGISVAGAACVLGDFVPWRRRSTD